MGSLKENFPSLYQGGGEAVSPQYSKFLRDFHWMNVISTLANHSFLQLGEVLDSDVGDVFAYLQYIHAKNIAERAEDKFQMDRIKARKH